MRGRGYQTIHEEEERLRVDVEGTRPGMWVGIWIELGP